MTQFGICDQNGLFASDFFQYIVHLYAPQRHDHLIKQAMKDIYGNVLHGLGVCWVSSTADGNSCRKLLRPTLQGIPSAKAAHRNAANVNLRRIHDTNINKAVKHGHHATQL